MHKVCVRLLSICIAMSFLAGCATNIGQSTSLRFNSIQVLNLTNQDIFDLQIEGSTLHRKFACGVILHRSICMNGFHARPLQESKVEISWRQGSSQRFYEVMELNMPETFRSDRVYSIQFVFEPSRQLSLSFVDTEA